MNAYLPLSCVVSDNANVSSAGRTKKLPYVDSDIVFLSSRIMNGTVQESGGPPSFFFLNRPTLGGGLFACLFFRRRTCFRQAGTVEHSMERQRNGYVDGLCEPRRAAEGGEDLYRNE